MRLIPTESVEAIYGVLYDTVNLDTTGGKQYKNSYKMLENQKKKTLKKQKIADL